MRFSRRRETSEEFLNRSERIEVFKCLSPIPYIVSMIHTNSLKNSISALKDCVDNFKIYGAPQVRVVLDNAHYRLISVYKIVLNESTICPIVKFNIKNCIRCIE